MTDHDLQPIVRRMVIYLRQVEDCLQRASDQLEQQIGMERDECDYVDTQVERAKTSLGRALNCVEELPTGNFALAATAAARSTES